MNSRFPDANSHAHSFFLPLIITILSLTISLSGYSQVFDGTVSFRNQTEVDTFPPYTEITQGLYIYPGVNNVDSLYRIKKIGSILSLVYASGLTNVDGFSNIDTIGGNLSLDGTVSSSGPNVSLSNLNGFSGLRYVGGSLLVESFDALTDLRGLDNLKTIANGFLIEGNASLETLVGLGSLDSLYYAEIKNNPSLKNVDGLSGLTYVGLLLSIQANPQLEDLSGLSALRTVQSDLRFRGNISLQNLNGLSNLKRIGGSLSISGSLDPTVPDQLSSLSGMSSLEEVDDFIGISNLYALKNFSGFPALKRLGKGVTIVNNIGLENLDGLQLPGAVNFLDILGNTSLKNIDGLAGVRDVERIRIEGNPQLLNVDGLASLQSSPYELWIVDNQSLVSLTGLLSISSLGNEISSPNFSTLAIRDNPSLRSLHGLENLRKILGGLSIINNSSLQEIDAFGRLDSVKGRIFLGNNWILTDVYGFRNLEYTLPTLFFSSQAMLNDCCGLYKFVSSLDSATAANIILDDVGAGCSIENILLNGPCEEKKRFVLKGKALLDGNDDCQTGTQDFPLLEQLVQADPGPVFSRTDIAGEYALRVDTGTYAISVSNGKRYDVCEEIDPQQVGLTDSTVLVDDFIVQGDRCPDLTVDIGGFWARRCFPGTVRIELCNKGIVPATQGQLTVILPTYLEFLSADVAHSFDADSNLVFDIGTLPALQCQTLNIQTQVSCESEEILGLTQCIEATLFSPDICSATDPDWSGASLAILANCTNNLNRFVVVNVGQSSMLDSTEYRLYADSVLVEQDKLWLKSGGSVEFDVPGTGQMFRLEVDQVPNHPDNKLVSAALEGCIATLSANFSKGMIPQYPLPVPTPEPSFGVDCQEIVGAYDPNDKQVFPRGIGNDGLTRPGSRLNYLIRFQNTGTDTAFNIMVVDTLSSELDLLSLEIGAVSHPFEWEVQGSGQPILRFRFENILLPDSNINEPESHGFIQFSIDHHPTAPLGTEIENFADIFFDFNLPIRTNTVLNTLSNFHPQALGSISGITQTYRNNETTSIPAELLGKIHLYPNPAKDKLTLSLDNFPYQELKLTLVNVYGSVAYQSSQKVVHAKERLNFELPDLAPGLYLVQINGAYVEKVLIR